MPDYLKMAASYEHITAPNAPDTLMSLSQIVATNESVVPVVNLIVSGLNQGKLAVAEWEGNVTPSEAWVGENIVVKAQVAMKVSIPAMNQTGVKQQNVSDIESKALRGVISIQILQDTVATRIKYDGGVGFNGNEC